MRRSFIQYESPLPPPGAKPKPGGSKPRPKPRPKPTPMTTLAVGEESGQVMLPGDV